MLKNNYAKIALITTIILLLVSLLNGFFPFGSNYIVWGDLHSQITAFHFQFYDAVYGNSSLLIDYMTAGATDFYGLICYYILSPFTLLTLLFPRELIPHSITLIIYLKIILSSITMFYMLNNLFGKLNINYKFALALLYAFSSYVLSFYLIPTWLDLVYLLPLLILGLKKLLNNESKILYLVTLTLSLLFNFYLAFITLFIIIFLSFFYTKELDYKKKVIKDLTLTTILSIGISSVVVIPVVYQIFISKRASFDISLIFQTLTGPIIDKTTLFITLGLPIITIILLLFKYKENMNFLKKYLPCLIILLIPVLFEPTNKLLHLGSYIYYPYRYGHITTILLIIGAGYYLNKYKQEENIKIKNMNKLNFIIPTISIILISILTIYFYSDIQTCIYNLTFTFDKFIYVIMIIIFILTLITYFFLLKKKIHHLLL